MPTHILCLAGDTALQALPRLPNAWIHLYRVLRHIPTDSVTQEQARRPIAPGAERIRAIVECSFADAAAQAEALAGAPWRAFGDALDASGEGLFAFDAEARVPVPFTRGAADGGFRRWMLLRRAAVRPSDFRDAWFGRHADLVKRLPRVDGYVQNLVTARYGPDGQATDEGSLAVDGIAELCFADEAAMLQAYASDARLPLRDDGRALLAGNVTLLVQGTRVP
jgi:hypothetical protein